MKNSQYEGWYEGAWIGHRHCGIGNAMYGWYVALFEILSLMPSLWCAGADAKPVPKFKSARHHDNHGLSLTTTHKRVRFRPGHLAHFDHHRCRANRPHSDHHQV